MADTCIEDRGDGTSVVTCFIDSLLLYASANPSKKRLDHALDCLDSFLPNEFYMVALWNQYESLPRITFKDLGRVIRKDNLGLFEAFGTEFVVSNELLKH